MLEARKVENTDPDILKFRGQVWGFRGLGFRVSEVFFIFFIHPGQNDVSNLASKKGNLAPTCGAFMGFTFGL